MSDWWTQAACSGLPPIWWDSDHGLTNEGVEVCQTCPVRDACLAEALRREGEPGATRWGIFGGTTPNERSGRGKRAITAVCGTESGYTRHRRLAEPACDPCLAARRESGRERTERRLARLARVEEANAPESTNDLHDLLAARDGFVSRCTCGSWTYRGHCHTCAEADLRRRDAQASKRQDHDEHEVA